MIGDCLKMRLGTNKRPFTSKKYVYIVLRLLVIHWLLSTPSKYPNNLHELPACELNHVSILFSYLFRVSI